MQDALRRVFSLPVFLTLATLATAGGALSNVVPSDLITQEMPKVSAAMAPAKALFVQLRDGAAATPKPKYETVFEGRDIDGDGAADFANPTGMAVREHDAFGEGEFGASRDGGARRHEGVDYVARAGQEAVAPISGFVTKIGLAYADTGEFQFVEISNPALGVKARVFYLNPQVSVGQPVRLGSPIGKVRSLQDRYAGITNHVHMEVYEHGRRVNAETLIVAHEKRIDGRA
ncbi:MAG: peptidoglycan DD-metalloendopeptidase family protein [Caulobacteraceae bacterium]